VLAAQELLQHTPELTLQCWPHKNCYSIHQNWHFSAGRTRTVTAYTRTDIAVLVTQELLQHTPELTLPFPKHYVGLPLRDANTRLAGCIISWRGCKQLRDVRLTEICCYGNVFKREDEQVWVSQMTLTVACHPLHRCGCISIVTGLDLLCYPGGQKTAVRSVRVAESRGETQAQKVSRITPVIWLTLGAL
jgi:hypothetical protein